MTITPDDEWKRTFARTERLERRNRILMTLAAICVLSTVSGYYGYKRYMFGNDPLLTGIPPHENLDGTIDYTLAFPVSQKHDGYYWVVRFPKNQYVELSQPGETRIEIPGTAVYGLKSYNNQMLTTYFKLQSFQPFTKPYAIDEILKAPHVEVVLSNVWSDRAENSAIFLNKDSKGCVALGEVAKNIYAYEPRGNSIDTCVFQEASFKQIGYSIRNEKGLHLAEMSCDIEYNGSCHGRSVLKFGRYINFSFKHAQLPVSEYANMFAGIETYLTNSTIKVEKIEAGQTYTAGDQVK
jgi:hypothetical protein